MRASTRRQAEAQAIDQQIRRLRAHARDRGREPPGANAFRDDGYSGATPRRPGLDRLRDAAAMAAFDAILLTDPDRPARNFAHRALLLGERQARGRRVESLDRPTSRDPHDRLLLRIRGAVAEYERAPIAGRTRRGRRRRYRAGEMLPRARAPCGYRMAADRPRGPEGAYLDPAEAAVVADMFTWYSEGRRTPHGPVDRLRDLGVPAPSGEPRRSDASARGTSRDPAYAGRAYAGRHTCREARARRSAAHPIGRPHGAAEPTPRDEWIDVGPIPAVVDRDLLDRVRAESAADRSFSARNNEVGAYLPRRLVSRGRRGLACIARRRPPHYGHSTRTGKSRAARDRDGATRGSRYIPAAALDELARGACATPCGTPRRPPRGPAARRSGAGTRRSPGRGASGCVGGRRRWLVNSTGRPRRTRAGPSRRRNDLEMREAAPVEREARLAGESDRRDEVLGLAATPESFRERVSAGLEAANFDQGRQLIESPVDRAVVKEGEVEIRDVLPTSPRGEHVRFCRSRLDYLHHPATSLPPSRSPLRAGPLPGRADVLDVPVPLDHLTGRGAVVAGVRAQVLLDLLGVGTLRHDRLDRLITLAPAITTPSGPPSASTSRLFLVPGLPRSVGFGPVSSPPNRALPSIPSAACHFQSTAPRSSHSATGAARIRSKTPFSHRRWNQRWIELSSPKRSGNSFHRQPLRRRKMIPLIACRQSMRGRPPCCFGGGGVSSRRIGSMIVQRSSVSSQIVSSGSAVRAARPTASPPDVEVRTS